MEEEQDGNAVQKACSSGAVRRAMPQRQRNAGNAAVVEEEQEGNAAVVEEEQDGNAVKKACSSGDVRKAIPQRQRNVGNAAVVEEGESRMWPMESVSEVP